MPDSAELQARFMSLRGALESKVRSQEGSDILRRFFLDVTIRGEKLLVLETLSPVACQVSVRPRGGAAAAYLLVRCGLHGHPTTIFADDVGAARDYTAEWRALTIMDVELARAAGREAMGHKATPLTIHDLEHEALEWLSHAPEPPAGSMPMVDPLLVIARARPGMMMYARNQLAGSTWEVSLFLREESRRIRAIPKRVEIEVRAALYDQPLHDRSVLLIPIVARVGPMRDENLWETWINIHAPGESPLADLQRQDRLVLHFVGDRGKIERSIAVSNSLREIATTAAKRAADEPPWSMNDFDMARETLYQRFPSIRGLWQDLGRAGSA